jgi:hypothetical protein
MAETGKTVREPVLENPDAASRWDVTSVTAFADERE